MLYFRVMLLFMLLIMVLVYVLESISANEQAIWKEVWRIDKEVLQLQKERGIHNRLKEVEKFLRVQCLSGMKEACPTLKAIERVDGK